MTTTTLARGRGRDLPRPEPVTTTEPPATTRATSPPVTEAAPPPSPPPSRGIHLTRVANLASPIAAASRPGTGNDLYVAERGGRIVRLSGNGTVRQIANLGGLVSGGGERGLLGLAFSGDGRVLYASYTDGAGALTLDAIGMSGDTTGARSTVLKVPHPRSNHNGGDVQRGPDGAIYWSLGDGGGGGDPDRNGQNINALLGKVLRLQPRATGGYAVPGDNPFVGRDGRDEIWLFGVRNPWRISFDRANGDLWIGDVGQGAWEEIDHLPGPGRGRGANLGWNLREGTHPYNGGSVPAGHVAPIHEYSHAGGNCSVTGGFVYRGSRIPSLVGAYVFGDYCVGTLRTLRGGSAGALGPTVGGLASFAQDASGELYALSVNGGVYRLDP